MNKTDTKEELILNHICPDCMIRMIQNGIGCWICPGCGETFGICG